MNKRMVAAMMAVICLGLSGCKSEDVQDVPVDVVSQSFTREPNTTATTMAETTDETTEETTEQSSDEITNDTTQATEKKSLVKGRVSKSALEEISGTLDTSAKAGSNSIEGRLSFSKEGFVFTPNMGTPFTLNVDNIMLVIVEYKMESTGEKLSLLTPDGQYTFDVEDGYCQELSKYIIIGESQESKSRGILGYRVQGS